MKVGSERLESVWRAGDAALDERGRVLCRQLVRLEAHTGRRRLGQAVDAEGAPVLATAIALMVPEI
jgi:hypothetical protein